MRGHVIPILQVIVFPVCCIATYLWAVLLGHVEAGFPYISDTGTYPPESCLFGLLLALFSATSSLSVHLRWQQVRTFYQNDASRGLHRANNVSVVMGHIAAFGVLLVANFQETNVLAVHLIGAFLAFIVGTVYAWVQTYVSYKAILLPGHRSCLRHLRLVLSAVSTLCTVFVVVFASIASNKNGQANKDEDHKKWSPSDKGFGEHVASTSFEWALAFVFVVFFATFSFEFRHFTIALPVEFTVVTTVDEVVTNGNEEDGRFVSSRELETSSAVFTVSSDDRPNTKD